MNSDRQAAGGSAGFTLMELMVVVGIIGLVAAMSIPSILQMRREAPMRKAVNDVLELCERARAGAVLKNTTTAIVFHPRTGQADLQNGDANAALSTRLGQGPIMSTQFDPGVSIQALEINLRDYSQADDAPVHFHDDGTCDEMTLVLACAGELDMITLELTTALPTVKPLQGTLK